MRVFKVFWRLKDGTLCSVFVPCRSVYCTEYQTGKSYDGVFAFRRLKDARELVREVVGWNTEIWRCEARKTRKVRIIPDASELSFISLKEQRRWLKKVLSARLSCTWALPKKMNGNNPLWTFTPMGTVICNGLRLVSKVE